MLSYIREQRAAGHSDEEIRQQLIASGWQQADIEEGLKAPTGSTASFSGSASGPLPGLGALFSEAWRLYNQRFWPLIGTYLAPMLVFFGVGLLAGAGFVLNKATGNVISGPIAIVILLIAVVAAIYIGVWGQAAMLIAIRDSSENIPVKEAYKRARPFIGAYFSTSLLAGLAVLGGFILFIIPGIIFALWFCFATYAVVTDNVSNTAALKFSKSIVKGQMGAIFWRFLFIGVLTIIFSWLVTAAGTSIHNEQVGSLLNSIFSLFWSPLAAVYGFLLFQHAKSRK